MLEARELVQQCVSAGPESAGYREFVGLAPGVASLPARGGYRLYLESLFDELSTDVKVLFDRRDAASLLWPRHNAFHKLLDRTEPLRAFSTCGPRTRRSAGSISSSIARKSGKRCVTRARRRATAESSPCGTSSSRLATSSSSSLITRSAARGSRCSPRPSSTSMCSVPRRARGGAATVESSRIRATSGSLIPHAVRDTFFSTPSTFLSRCTERPGSIRLRRWRIAWTDRCVTCSRPRKTLNRALPTLIVENNLHGVDIDPRAAQIAALALWLRAQRAWREAGIEAADRPPSDRTGIVIAEPMPGDAGDALGVRS